MAKAMGYKVIGTCAEGKKDVGLACGVDELIVLPEVVSSPAGARRWGQVTRKQAAFPDVLPERRAGPRESAPRWALRTAPPGASGAQSTSGTPPQPHLR